MKKKSTAKKIKETPNRKSSKNTNITGDENLEPSVALAEKEVESTVEPTAETNEPILKPEKIDKEQKATKFKIWCMKQSITQVDIRKATKLSIGCIHATWNEGKASDSTIKLISLLYDIEESKLKKLIKTFEKKVYVKKITEVEVPVVSKPKINKKNNTKVKKVSSVKNPKIKKK